MSRCQIFINATASKVDPARAVFEWKRIEYETTMRRVQLAGAANEREDQASAGPAKTMATALFEEMRIMRSRRD